MKSAVSPTDTGSELPSTSSAQAVTSQQNLPSNSNPIDKKSATVATRETIEKLARSRKRVADSLAERLPAKKARKRRMCVKSAEPKCHPSSQTVKIARTCVETVGNSLIIIFLSLQVQLA